MTAGRSVPASLSAIGGEGRVRGREVSVVCEELTPYARDLRRSQTDAERKLWFLLRDRRLSAFKFRRQHPIGPFIVDFGCTKTGVVVELDGGQHAGDRRADEKRSAFLENQGYRVLRFWNNKLLGDAPGVLQRIEEALAFSVNRPLTLPPMGEREEERA